LPPDLMLACRNQRFLVLWPRMRKMDLSRRWKQHIQNSNYNENKTNHWLRNHPIVMQMNLAKKHETIALAFSPLYVHILIAFVLWEMKPKDDMSKA
jgi:hypothetical protein